MSSIVCQGLQTFLEPLPMEPNFLKKKLVIPRSNSSQKMEEGSNQNGKNCEKTGGWSFIQSLTNISNNFTAEAEKEKVYVHPLLKRSSSKLSAKSLEMCTESLGSESGSDNIDEFSLISLENPNFDEIKKNRAPESPKKMSRSCNFPPPLSSIGRSEIVRMRSHRENGRLVINFVTVSSSKTCFKAERFNGRLRLSVVREVEEEERQRGECWGEDMEGNSGNVGGEIGIGEGIVPTRCKESGSEREGMSSWGPFWVAIS